MKPSVTPLLMFEDNYGYLLSEQNSSDVIVVDPSDGEQVWNYLEKKGYRLTAILATHHHFDHVAGIDFLHSKKNIPVYSSTRESQRIPKASHGLTDQETVQIGELTIQAIHVPGHTAGHLAYQCGDALFTGDTLFLGGCGRLFEGTAQELYNSLYQKIMVLPENIRIFPGHEYTTRTRSFCLSIDEDNNQLKAALQEAKTLREKGLFTVPGSLNTEKQTNVFLRCREGAIIRALQSRSPGIKDDPLSIFSKLRSMMDVY